MKFNPSTNEYAEKVRTILDLRESDMTDATCTWHRSILPRATDAISDALELSSDVRPDEQLEAMVIDLKDAYWMIP